MSALLLIVRTINRPVFFKNVCNSCIIYPKQHLLISFETNIALIFFQQSLGRKLGLVFFFPQKSLF